MTSVNIFSTETLTIWTSIFIRDNILMQYVMGNNQASETTVLPQSLNNHVLKLANDELGHNGSTRTYMILKRLHNCKDLKTVVHK